MKYFGVNELREKFLSFFESKGHLRLPSFSLVPQNDKSLLLINSGMAPMKPWFTGEQEPPCPRVVTCQKCIRTGDIENIGKTSRHGTYFEMLGNFSFGDYFKSESLKWTWEFLTETLGIDADRLCPSVYLEDDEAFDIWVDEIGIPPEKITRLGKADNFWEHGSGPCGPCSEVYFDRGAKHGCENPDCAPGCDCDRYIEIWNNVFSQFDNDGNNNYTELSQKNIDTGMGLERLAVVCQNVNSLFDIDTVMNITDHISRISGAVYGGSDKTDVSLRIITDHIRSSVMMISDGILPSNEGRGYVLRRLLRRAARHGRLLGVKDAFLHEVCETVIRENEGAYPEVRERAEHIKRITRAEEDNFNKTLDAGMEILERIFEAAAKSGGGAVPGGDAFRLYDTYGFPIDLTLELAEERGLSVDTSKFDELMQAQRERARTARLALGDLAWEGIDFGEDNTPTEFIGYDRDAIDLAQATLIQMEESDPFVPITAVITALVVGGEVVATMRDGDEGIIVIDRTPFYAEMGGQSADEGVITAGDAHFGVTDVQKTKGGKYLHHGKLCHGDLHTGDEVRCYIDTERRSAIMRAHSATHLLQRALREELGDHVVQSGSLVLPDRLRFDFTHFQAMTPEELESVEMRVNVEILRGLDIYIREMPIEEAKKIGAVALFGEKYGDTVRVVKMGDFSTELCGGTHLRNTSLICYMRIDSEFSVASGVRRIEAVTGLEAFVAARTDRRMAARVQSFLKATSPEDVWPRLEQLQNEVRDLRRAAAAAAAKRAGGEADDIYANAKAVGGMKVISAKVGAADADALRVLGDSLRDKDDSIIAVLAAEIGGKLTFLSVCGKTAVQRGMRAGDIIKHVTGLIGGSGGGKPDSAMGGAKDVSKLQPALDAVYEFVKDKLN